MKSYLIRAIAFPNGNGQTEEFYVEAANWNEAKRVGRAQAKKVFADKHNWIISKGRTFILGVHRSVTYFIMGKCGNDAKEKIDEFQDNKMEAYRCVKEYRLAYQGSGYSLWVEKHFTK